MWEKMNTRYRLILLVFIGTTVWISIAREFEMDNFPGLSFAIGILICFFIFRQGWIDGSKMPRKKFKKRSQ
jgi:hypothetical protein